MQIHSAANSTIKSTQLCYPVDQAICVSQVSGMSLLIAWIRNWGCKLYFSPV